MNDLKFKTLRAANRARLPLFKNRHGAPAHSKPDGSDWSPAQWIQAVVGELGEMCHERALFEAGAITPINYTKRVRAEAADIVTYIDLFAQRAYDTPAAPAGERSGLPSRAQVLMGAIASIGRYANAAKKHDRGDLTDDEFDKEREGALYHAITCLELLMHRPAATAKNDPADLVAANAYGFDLGGAVAAKFNQVSERVGAQIFLEDTQ